MNIEILSGYETIYTLHQDDGCEGVNIDADRVRRWQRVMRSFRIAQEEMEAFYFEENTSCDD